MDPAIEGLLASLQHTDAAERIRAARELGKLCPVPEAALPALVRALDDDGAVALDSPDFTPWSGGGWDAVSYDRVRTEARVALAAAGLPALPHLHAALGGASAAWEAAEIVEAIPLQALATVPREVLTALWGALDASPRQAAVDRAAATVKFALDHGATDPVLILRCHPNGRERAVALPAVAASADTDAPALEALLEATVGPETSLASTACMALLPLVSRVPEPWIGRLIAAVAQAPPRNELLGLIAALGPRAGQAAAVLEGLIGGAAKGTGITVAIRREACRALIEVAPAAATSVLARVFLEAAALNLKERSEVRDLVVSLAPAREELVAIVLSSVLDGMRSTHWNEVERAADALADLSRGPAREAVPVSALSGALERILRSGDLQRGPGAAHRAANSCFGALRWLEPRATQALDAVLACVREPSTVDGALFALEAMQPLPTEARAALATLAAEHAGSSKSRRARALRKLLQSPE